MLFFAGIAELIVDIVNQGRTKEVEYYLPLPCHGQVLIPTKLDDVP